MAKVMRYFLGVHSPQGYVYRSDQLGEPGRWRCWVVTGGAAASRRRLIARVRRAMEERCPVIEELLCSDDPTALSGAILPALSASVADGEPPHTIRTRHPGAYERPVSLWDCVDLSVLWQVREELIRRSQEAERLSQDAAGYLYAAGALTRELASVGAEAMDREKLLAFARRLAAKEFPRSGGENAPPGQEKTRFLSAVTAKGTVLLRDTIAAAAPRVIAIEDDWGAVSNALLEALGELAVRSGQEAVVCRCPLFPFTKTDHLLLPGLGLGFVTLNRATSPILSGLPERTIHAGRFSDPEPLRRHRARGRFLRKAVSGMLDQAALALHQASDARREADEIFLKATDQEKVEETAERVIAEMG